MEAIKIKVTWLGMLNPLLAIWEKGNRTYGYEQLANIAELADLLVELNDKVTPSSSIKEKLEALDETLGKLK
jgi:hypothetical protein